MTIFGKTYQVDEIPRKIYYKYEDSDNPEYIDMSSVNFNEDMGTGTASASKGQYECNWISMQVTLNKDGDINATLNTNYVKTMARNIGLRYRAECVLRLFEFVWQAELGR